MRKVKLRAEGITHMYKGEGGREIKALEDVTLDIYENEFVTIIGPSGYGKTTFLNILAGFIKPTQGKVFCDGKEVTGPGPECVCVAAIIILSSGMLIFSLIIF